MRRGLVVNPYATELARSLTRLHDAQMRAARAAKTPAHKREADQILIKAHRAYNAARRAFEDAKQRTSKLEAAE